jgi:alpha-mannosidase
MTDPLTSTDRMHQIQDAIKRLRALTQVSVQNHWRYCPQDLPAELANQSERWSDWATADLNPKGYIVWSAGRQVMWLSQRFIIPQALQEYPLAGLALRLALTWWAESAQIFVNGQLVQEGDLFDSSGRVLLAESVVPGQEIAVALRLVSPGHDIGALMRSRNVYEAIDSIESNTLISAPSPLLPVEDTLPPPFPSREGGLGGLGSSPIRIEPGFIADELEVLRKYLEAFAPEKLDDLAAGVAEMNWEAVSHKEKFDRSLSTLRQNLQSLVGENSTLPLPKQRCIRMLGHAHLDLAWLWPVSETWEVAQRTFESVLKLQQEFPELTFCHSTPALYAWIEQHRPDLFAAIIQQIAANRWEVVGGMWVEPELNLISGESIVRQILYAQRYVQEKFGRLTTVAWVPDSFGFCWQLPQLLRQGGIEYFVTQKLHWNDTTKFPYGAFWWESPDGTQIFSLISPPNVTGVMDTNPITMASYAIDWETQTHLKDIFWLPGVGDHGGGPTRDMLQVAQRWERSPFFPSLEFTTASSYLSAVSNQDSLKKTEGDKQKTTDNGQLTTDIPVWNHELYLEFHRGCYTTHADQKRWNRRCEGLLYQAELFASLATLSAGSHYPKQQVEDAWKKVLFNQFHDILPGTSIPEVFVEANQAWQEVEQVAVEIVEESLKAIASQIALPSPPQPDAQPIIVFNPLNWQRSELVAVSLPQSSDETYWEIYDVSGQKLLSERSEATTLLFLAQDIPSIGYRVFWLSRCNYESSRGKACLAPTFHNAIPQQEDWVLENELLRVVVDPNTGDLTSIFDKIHQREVLSGSGNQLQAFEDKGQYWDAWNIDPNYAQHPLPPSQLKSIQWIDRRILRSRLRVVRYLGQSEFCQDYILDAKSPILKIATTVDWQEHHVLVKAAFPLNLEADSATYEIPCGAIQRPTRPQTPAEQAKWEVPALRWADLTDSQLEPTEHHQSQSNLTSNASIQNPYGVSLLNDCKYGYDSQPSQLRLTLLRSPCWPDSEADRGIHQFTYALYPHPSSWQSAGTVRKGYELNVPLIAFCNFPVDATSPKPLQPVGRLLDLPAENLVLMAFKPSEDVSKQWILRCYECHGESAELSLESDLGLRLAHSVDLLEQRTSKASGQSFSLAPWKIATFTLERSSRTTQGNAIA